MAANASNVQSAAEVHAKLRAHPEIQFDLPQAKPPEPPPRWLTDMLETLFGALSLPEWVLWSLLGAVGLLLLFLVVRWLSGSFANRGASASAEDEVAAWRPEEKAARALLAEAEAMAEAGRYEEAVRLLLHRSLEDIQRRRPKLLRPALTSREISRVPLLPDAVRGAFDAMAAPVERSLFGGRKLDRGAWESAREAYRAFALPEAWA